MIAAWKKPGAFSIPHSMPAIWWRPKTQKKTSVKLPSEERIFTLLNGGKGKGNQALNDWYHTEQRPARNKIWVAPDLAYWITQDS
jgi:hypothetical protein